MGILLVKLTDRLNSEHVIDNIQIDQAADQSNLSSLLNAMLSKESEYFFFYGQDRIHGGLSELVEKHSLSTEEVVNIEFVDKNEIVADTVTECDDTVISMCFSDSSVFYLTYSGNVFKMNDTQDSNRNQTLLGKFTGLKGLFSCRKLFGFLENRILDISNNCIFYEAESEIMAAAGSEDCIVIGLCDKVILISPNETREVYHGEDLQVENIKIHKESIAWIQRHDNIAMCDTRDTEFPVKVHKTEYILTDITILDGWVISTTANNSILVLDENETKQSDIPYRLARCLRSQGNQLIYTTQHEIVSFIITPDRKIKEKAVLMTKGQINDMICTKDRLYVANDTFISTFKIERLQ